MKKTQKNLIILIIAITTFLIGINNIYAKSLPGEIIVSKTAEKENKVYGRNATITLSVNANSFTTIDETDVVIVIDRSTSMSGDKMTNTIEAAKSLINSIVNDTTSSKVKCGIVTYGREVFKSYTSKNLTNDNKSLISLVNRITSNSSINGTNIHAGLLQAKELLSNSKDGVNKVVILLTDGEPYQYIGKDSTTICESDDGGNKCKSSPSKAAINIANMMKTDGITIYTVGFDIQNNNTAKKVLTDISTDPDGTHSYLASDYNSLKEAFNNMVKDFTVVANNAIVTDIIPSNFKLDEELLPDNIEVIENSDKTTTIAWSIGDISSLLNNKLSYKIEALENDYGSMYTNTKATLTAISSNYHPIYGSNKPILINFENPIVDIPCITNNDDYSNNSEYYVERGKTLVIKKEEGLLANDLLKNKNTDNDKEVVNKIVLINDNTDNMNNINVNTSTGEFIYIAPKDIVGKVTYKYYIETTIKSNDSTNIVKSNTSTITINVIKEPTSYIVHYYEKGTTKSISDDKIITKNVYVYDKIKEEAININDYDKINPSSMELVLGESNNEITFYYTKTPNTTYKIYYKEKGTNRELSKPKEVINQKYNDNITEEAINIEGYSKISPISVTINISNEVNEHIFYYVAKKSVYTINHYILGTTTKVSPTETKVATYGTKINSVDEKINDLIDYKYNSVDPKEIIIKTNSKENIINIYYTEIKGTVKTMYIDNNNKEILDSNIITGKINTKYKTFPKEIDKYKLIRIEGKEEDVYNDKEILVRYIYEKVPDTRLYKNNARTLIPLITSISFFSILFLKRKLLN